MNFVSTSVHCVPSESIFSCYVVYTLYIENINVHSIISKLFPLSHVSQILWLLILSEIVNIFNPPLHGWQIFPAYCPSLVSVISGIVWTKTTNVLLLLNIQLMRENQLQSTKNFNTVWLHVRVLLVTERLILFRLYHMHSI